MLPLLSKSGRKLTECGLKQPDIRVGQSIDVVFRDRAGKTLKAKVATTSESITPNSRTLLVELHLDNPGNQIQPGSYAQVRLTSGSLGQIVT